MRKTIRSKAISGITAAVMLLTCAMPVAVNAVESPTKENAMKTLETGITISADKISTENYKDTRFNNPISPDFFCAQTITSSLKLQDLTRTTPMRRSSHFSFSPRTIWSIGLITAR